MAQAGYAAFPLAVGTLSQGSLQDPNVYRPLGYGPSQPRRCAFAPPAPLPSGPASEFETLEASATGVGASPAPPARPAPPLWLLPCAVVTRQGVLQRRALRARLHISSNGQQFSQAYANFSFVDQIPSVWSTFTRQAAYGRFAARGPNWGNTEIYVQGLGFLPSEHIAMRLEQNYSSLGTYGGSAFQNTEDASKSGALQTPQLQYGRCDYDTPFQLRCFTPAWNSIQSVASATSGQARRPRPSATPRVRLAEAMKLEGHAAGAVCASKHRQRECVQRQCVIHVFSA